MYKLFLVFYVYYSYLLVANACQNPEPQSLVYANGMSNLSPNDPLLSSVNKNANVTDCMAKIFTDSHTYDSIHKFVDDSIHKFVDDSIWEYLRTKLGNLTDGNPTQSTCPSLDSWATSCGVSSKILCELISLNNTYGNYGVKVCPNAIQIAYAGFGILDISFYLEAQSCPESYRVIINKNSDHAKIVSAEKLLNMIQNIVSLTKASRTANPNKKCNCNSVEHILFDIASGVFYSNNSVFFICNPIIIIDGKNNLKLLMGKDYVYKIPSADVENVFFLQSFFRIPGSALYFDRIRNISLDMDCSVIKDSNFFFVKRNPDGKMRLYISQPLVMSSGVSPRTSYERPSCELESVQICPREFVIHASIKGRPGSYISIYVSITRGNRKMLNLLTKVL